MSASVETDKTLIQHGVETCNAGDVELVPNWVTRAIAPAAIMHLPSGDFTGAEGYPCYHEDARAEFPETHVTIDEMSREQEQRGGGRTPGGLRCHASTPPISNTRMPIA